MLDFNLLFQHKQNFTGHIAMINTINESSIQVIREVLTQTNATFSLYNHQDVTELIRSYEMPAALLERIHIHTFDSAQEAIAQCLQDLDNQCVDILMKGLISTAELLSAVLKHLNQNMKIPFFMNHLACCEIPDYHKLLFISDVALNVQPTVEEHQKIIKNIKHFATQLGYQKLKVAMLSSVETPSSKIPSSTQAKELKQIFSGENDEIQVEGPLAFDNAINKQSAILKGIDSSVAGDADALIVPQIDVGNVLYKSLTYFGRARVASLIIGAPYPIILTSRADSVSNKVNSVLLALKSLS
ncbi:phosphate acyltransferase [Staphylococcus chromogenes]|uniref:phosphate acyltransferase n=1 Tax=Staphylococcus chromogenes TaxID=46126 RepID=UPI003D78D996